MMDEQVYHRQTEVKIVSSSHEKYTQESIQFKYCSFGLQMYIYDMHVHSVD